MHAKKAAFAFGLSLATVAILVPLVSRVKHFGVNSQQCAGACELRADGNPIPPLPPTKGKIGSLETLSADGNPIPPLPPTKGKIGSLEALSADGNPIPPLPPTKGKIGSLETFSADRSLPPPKNGHDKASVAIA